MLKETPALNFTVSDHFTDPGDETSAWEVYIQALISKVQEQRHEVETYDQRLSGLLCLACYLAKRPELRELLCQCNSELLPKALQDIVGIDGSLDKLLETLL